MLKITSSELRKRMGEALVAVQSDTIQILRHGRPMAFLLSVEDYEKYSDAMDVTEGWFTRPNRFARYEDRLTRRARSRAEADRETELMEASLPAMHRRLTRGQYGPGAHDIARLEARLAGLRAEAKAEVPDPAPKVSEPQAPPEPPRERTRWWRFRR